MEHSYISTNIKNIHNPSIFRAIVCLEPEEYSEHCQTSTKERIAKIAT